MWRIGRVAVSRHRSKAELRLLPQGWNVSSRAGCLPTSSENSLNSAVVPLSLTPRNTLGFGGTSVTAEAVSAADRPATVAKTATVALTLSEHIAHPPWLDPELNRVGCSPLRDHRHLHQLRLLPGRKHRLAENGSHADQSCPYQREGDMDQGSRPARYA